MPRKSFHDPVVAAIAAESCAAVLVTTTAAAVLSLQKSPIQLTALSKRA